MLFFYTPTPCGAGAPLCTEVHFRQRCRESRKWKCARKTFIALPLLTNDKFVMKGEPNVFRFVASFQCSNQASASAAPAVVAAAPSTLHIHVRNPMYVSLCVYVFVCVCVSAIVQNPKRYVYECVAVWIVHQYKQKVGVVYNSYLCLCMSLRLSGFVRLC